MYLRIMPNLLHFLPDLDANYALRHVPNFFENHPWYVKQNTFGFRKELPTFESYYRRTSILYNFSLDLKGRIDQSGQLGF